MASNTVRIKGLDELVRAMRELPDKLERNVIRSALRAGAKVIEARAKELVPVTSGGLRDSISVSTRTIRGTPYATIKAGAHYAPMVEFGTKQHLISATGVVYKKTRRGMKRLSVASLNYRIEKGVLSINGKILGETVIHPGAQPKPFMRPAMDSAAQAALLAVGLQIRKRLTKAGLDTADITVEAVDPDDDPGP